MIDSANIQNHAAESLPVNNGQREKTFDILARTATATGMAVSTSFCIERNFLNDLELNASEFVPYLNGTTDNNIYNTRWFEVSRIGRPDVTNMSACFKALQNILMACHIPYTQLLFLIRGHNRTFKMYMGLQATNTLTFRDIDNVIKEISAFAEVSWPGTKTKVLSCDQCQPIKDIMDQQYANAYALTGIPSLDLKDNNYPSTIEYLLGGQKAVSDMTYLIIANPLNDNQLTKFIYDIDDIRGQAETFKSFNFSIANQQGEGNNLSDTISTTINESESKNSSEKNSKGTLLSSLIGIGVAATAAYFGYPPLESLKGTTALAGALSQSAMLGSMTTGILGAFVPQEGTSVSSSKGKTEGQTIGLSHNSSYTETLGQTIVNTHIENISDTLKQQSKRFQLGKAHGMWEVGCYLFTDEDNVSTHLQLKSLLCGNASTLEPIRVHNITKLLDEKPSVSPFVSIPDIYIRKKEGYEPFEHPLGKIFSQLTTCLTTEEMTSMINFPLHSVPGISVVDRPPEFPLNAPGDQACKYPIKLGKLVNRGDETNIPYYFDIDSLTRHALVCGTNGSGKTNTVMNFLGALTEHNKDFMVIEPAKTEYVDWALNYNIQLKKDQEAGLRLDQEPIVIYMPGKDTYWHSTDDSENIEYKLTDVLRLNPFEPVSLCSDKIPNVQAHLDRIKSIFALAFPMEDILPTVMESLLREAYTTAEPWLNRRRNTPLPELYPTLGLVSSLVSRVVSNLGYEPKVTGNIRAALNLRLNNLMSGWKRNLLNNEVLGGYKFTYINGKKQLAEHINWEQFFKRKMVINLSGISDDSDRTFVMGLLLLYLYEYRIARSETPDFNFNVNELEHLVVIEEAHRVMMNNPNPDSAQYKCGQLFSNLLSEIRAYRQGIMIVDQVPSRLISDAIKNTNLKVIHRILAADDVNIVADAMGITAEQRKIIPKLSVGQAIVSGISNSTGSIISEETNNYWCNVTYSKS